MKRASALFLLYWGHITGIRHSHKAAFFDRKRGVCDAIVTIFFGRSGGLVQNGDGLPKDRPVDMSVAHGGPDVRVSKETLDRRKVRTFLRQVRGERMPQGVPADSPEARPLANRAELLYADVLLERIAARVGKNVSARGTASFQKDYAM